MPTNDCLKALRKDVKDLSADDLQQVIGELKRRLRAKRAEGRVDAIDLQIIREADTMAEEMVEAAILEKRNQLMNLVVRQRVLDTVQGIYDDNPGLGLEAMLAGINNPRPGGRFSIAAQGHAIMEEHFGRFVDDLEKADLLVHFNNRTIERDVARELWEFRDQGKPGISGNKKAQGIAEIIRKYEDLLVDRQNRAGAFIRKLPGYIVRQSHDQRALRKAGFEAWRDKVLPRLADETFEGVSPDKYDDFLRGIYEGLSTGVHLKYRGDATGDVFLGFKGPGNLAKRISQDRVLHFKTADDWMDYNDDFGGAALREQFVFGIERAAKNTALMESLGTNPRAMFDTVRKDLRARYRKDPKKIDGINAKFLDAIFREIDGTTRVAVNPSGALIGAVTRAIQNMAKLGGATISALTDIPFLASEVRYQGKGLLSGYGLALKNVVEGFKTPADRKRVSRLVGVGLDGMRGDILARFGAVDNLPGSMARLQQLFFRMNLLTWWTDSHKRGVGLMMSNHLYDNRLKVFDKLDSDLKKVLGQYGITDREWSVIRAAGHISDDQGRGYLVADILRENPAIDDVIQLAYARFKPKGGLRATVTEKIKIPKLSKAKLARIKDELSTKLNAFYTDRVNFAVPTPGAKEFAVMRFGTQPGTVMGEAIRLMMQFKAFPITVLTKPISRELFGTGATSITAAMKRGRGNLGLAHLIFATTMMGYVAQSAKQLAKGRTPRDPELPETWVAAAAQGGGFGIYGDFMFGEFNRFGRSFVSTAAGPTASVIDDLAEIYTRFRTGDDAAAQVVRTLVNNSPFINLFYTRVALDYLILYQIQETLNPGYLRRLERKLLKDNNQQFIVPPSRVIPRGGGSTPFKGIR